MRIFPAVVLCVAAAVPAHAQITTTPVDVFGRILSPSLRTGLPRPITPMIIGAAEQAAKPFRFAALGYDNQRSVSGANISAGFGTDGGPHDYLLSATAARNGWGGDERTNQYTALGQIGLLRRGNLALSAAAVGMSTPGSFHLWSGVLGGEVAVGPLAIDGNAAWTDLRLHGGGSVSDLQPSAGVAWSVDKAQTVTLAADYTLKNDVDGEDVGSATISLRLPRIASTMKVSAQKHRLIRLSVTRYF